MTMGEQAGENCNDFGWAPLGKVDPSLVAEVTHHQRYGAGRAWSTRASYTLTQAPKRIYLVHTVEGGFEFTVDGKAVATEPGQLILLDGEASTTARTLAETARYVWYFDPAILRPGKTGFRFHEPIPVDNPSLRSLMAMTNTVLNTHAPQTPGARTHLGVAMEHLVAAALHETGVLPDGSAAMHRDDLFTSAQLVIESNFRDPGFDTPKLARELCISLRTMYAAFGAMGTTPRKEIERRRLTEVERLSDQLFTKAQTVELSGFTSMRQYARALHREASGSSAP